MHDNSGVEDEYLRELGARWNTRILQWGLPPDVVERFSGSPFSLNPASFYPQPDVAEDARRKLMSQLLDELEASDDTERPKTVLDVGAGAGSSLSPIADLFDFATCIEANPEMAGALRENMHLLYPSSDRYRIIEAVFPLEVHDLHPATVVNCSNVVYNVQDLVAFLKALNSLAEHFVVLEATLRHPLYRLNHLFEHFWSVERPIEPTVADIYETVQALGYNAEIRSFPIQYRRGFMDASKIAPRLGLHEHRLEELEAFLEKHPLPENPSVMLWWRTS